MNKHRILPKVKRIVDGLMNLFFCLAIFLFIYVLLVVFCFTSFKVPSDSMEPSLIAGDYILVNKLGKGARIFNINAALRNEDITIRRMPGYRDFRRNEVLVFNYPFPVRWGKIDFDIMQYYVKRCIGLPGDTVEIRNGYFRVQGFGDMLGNQESQHLISLLPDTIDTGIVMEAYPQDKTIDWTIKEFGPLWIPAKDSVVALNPSTFLLYSTLIIWEQKKPVTLTGQTVLLGDSIISTYRFLENYYFMAGDKSENSKDSRYWGLLPESFIVGKATHVWKSVDMKTGKLRRNRILKKIT